MKKLFLAMAAFAALFTSCSKDDTFGGPTRGKVTFEVSTPELATRYGEGTTATNLKYAVYDMIEDANGKLVHTGDAMLESKHANVSIDLVEGRKYTAIFWADAPNSPYTFTPATKTVSYTNVNDLTANNEAYDAFYAFVPQTDIKVGQTVNVTLKRPFAQLRIETSDTVRAKKLGVEVVKTGITVNAYTSFNLATGNVDGQQNITFKPTTKASASTTVGEVTYDLISMNYILANPTTADLVDVTLNFTDDVNGTEQNYVRQYNAVSVQRNHRTIVRGTILTDPTQFNVTVSEGFDGDIDEEHNTSETLVVSNADDIREAFENLNDNNPDNDPGTIVLGNDIDLSSGDWTSIFGYDNSASLSTMTRAGEEQDPSITIKKDQVLTLDLNGYTLSAISKQTGKNYDMIDVRGTLTVKNGTITTKHEGANMEWNASTNVFNVTDGGVLNLSNVIAKNEGGSDMAFVAHLNNWGEVTLNVDNSTLESTYIAVRVFNSGNDMNNVTIKNSTLKGKYSFWVHNYKAAGDSAGTDDTLNIDIYDGSNTFEYTGKAPILYGFANSIYYKVAGTAEDLAAKLNEGSSVILTNNINVEDPIYVPSSKNVILDLNGKTITGTDTITGSYGLININAGAELTINSSNDIGYITLSATNNRGWNAYSSVISNQQGKLTINEGVVIKHKGGTDMSYAIDNLTNGKGTYAETTINGGSVLSTYRAIRQFLNGIEAQNILTVNGGDIAGDNKSIWMQDTSKNANTGKLTVAAEAKLHSDVYLSVTEGSTEWPVEVSIASAALKNNSKVLGNNIPTTYEIQEVNGVWTVVEAGVTKVATAADLAAAIDGGDPLIKLTADITLAEPISITYNKKTPNVTIDLNDKTITATGTYAFFNGRTLTVKGNGTINATNGYCFKLQSMSTLNIEGGTFISGDADDQAEHYEDIVGEGFSDATLNISGGTFNFDPTAWVAEGKTATDNGNGTWTVQ